MEKEMKYIGPDPEVLKIINTILSLNAIILDVNCKLLKEFSSPIHIISPELLKEGV